MDFFTVPTATFDILYVLVFVHHARRRVVHLAVTRWPTAAWVVQQLREAFPFDEAPRFLIFDRDAKFSTAVVAAIRSFGIQPSQTAYRCKPFHEEAEEVKPEFMRTTFGGPRAPALAG